MGPARKEPDLATYSGRCAVRLRTLREKAGLTVEDVAMACGVHWKTIYNWEASNAAPSLDKLPLLAKAYSLKTPRSVLAEK